MGNTTVKWMTLYRQERKVHQAEIDKLTQEYDGKLLEQQKKNEWLSNQLIDAQKKLRVMTYEIALKEVQIRDLQHDLRRKTRVGRGIKKKTLVEASVPVSTSGRSGDNNELHLPE